MFLAILITYYFENKSLHLGNSWGVDGISKRACVGCGPQEEFYGCSDISIVENTDVNHSSHTSLKVMDISVNNMT